MTPYEALTGEKPNVSNLKVFGCICYAHIPKDERKKLDSKAREAIMLGYGTEVKGYRLYDPNSQRAFFSRDVIFEESRIYNYSEMVKPVNKVGKFINIVDENIKIQNTEVDDKIQTKEVDSTSNLNNDLTDTERKSSRNKKSPEYYGEWANAVNKTTQEPYLVKKVRNGLMQ